MYACVCTGLPSRLSFALGVVGAVAALAQGEIGSLDFDLHQTSNAQIHFAGGQDDNDDNRMLMLNLGGDMGVDYDWSNEGQARAALRDQYAHVENTSVFHSDAQSAMFSMDLNNSVGVLGENAFDSQGRHHTDFAMGVRFDEDTQVEVSLRIEYDAISFGDLSARLEVNGLFDEEGPTQIEIQDAHMPGVLELTIVGRALQNRSVRLESVLDSFNSLGGGDSATGSHMLSLSASIRSVPAPGGLALLGGLGLLAGRRRR